uniref:Peptidase S54 rhomboid domain-containing protein n=1 Tax=Babesia bovis TaxID=5865 RepID=S6B9W1_BABBO|nr:hypothetical protein [Babesia bovis]
MCKLGRMSTPLRYTALVRHRYLSFITSNTTYRNRVLRRSEASFIAPSVEHKRTRCCYNVRDTGHSYSYQGKSQSSDHSGSFNRILCFGSTAFALCRSWDHRGFGDDKDDNIDSLDGWHKDDDYFSVDIPIDFGHSNARPPPRSGIISPSGDYPPHTHSSGDYGLRRDAVKASSFSLMGIISSMNNVSPNGFGRFFLLCCGSVFGLWTLSDRISNPWLSQFLQRHFLASRRSFDMRRWHTLLTSSISHASVFHLFLNCMMFHQLINTFARNMAPPLPSRPSVSSIDRLFSSLSSSIEGFFWPSSQTKRRLDTVQTSDIMGVMVLSGICSSLGHVALYKTPVYGASGAISGLLYLLASTFPNSYFQTVFPVPGLQVSILQICQMFVATNVSFLFFGNALRNVAWSAHLFGFGAGAVYCYLQQHVFKRRGFRNPVTLSFRTASSQWRRTFKGIMTS